MSKVLTLTMNPALDLSTSIDKVVHTHKLRCTAAKTQPGGGGINVARVLSRRKPNSAEACIAVYPVGGLTGQLLVQALKVEDVRSEPVPISGETREAFSVHETSSGKDFRFLLPGPTLIPAEWQACLDKLLNLTYTDDTVIASGSLPPGVPDDFFAHLATAVKEKGARLVLDSSGVPLKLALQTGVYLVKPSLRELEELAGQVLETEAQWRSAAQLLLDAQQAEIVAVSLGAEGALVATPTGIWRATAIPVNVVSTVGAGDNFVAGFVWALRNQEPLEQCLSYAMASAAAAVMNQDSSLCDPESMHRLHLQAHVTRLS